MAQGDVKLNPFGWSFGLALLNPLSKANHGPLSKANPLVGFDFLSHKGPLSRANPLVGPWTNHEQGIELRAPIELHDSLSQVHGPLGQQRGREAQWATTC